MGYSTKQMINKILLLPDINDSDFAVGLINRTLNITALPSYFDNITSIGDYAFYNCENLALTTLPSGITSIGNAAFYGCKSLTSITIPSGVTSIGSCFQNCENLETVTFEGTPTTISEYAFSECYNLKTINVPWAEGAVAGAPWGDVSATIINYNYTG